MLNKLLLSRVSADLVILGCGIHTLVGQGVALSGLRSIFPRKDATLGRRNLRLYRKRMEELAKVSA